MQNRHRIDFNDELQDSLSRSSNPLLKVIADANFRLNTAIGRDDEEFAANELAANQGRAPMQRDINARMIEIVQANGSHKVVNSIEEIEADFAPFVAIYSQSLLYQIYNIVANSHPQVAGLFPSNGKNCRFILKKQNDEIFFELIQEAITLSTPPNGHNEVEEVIFDKPIHLFGKLDGDHLALSHIEIEPGNRDLDAVLDDIFHGQTFADFDLDIQMAALEETLADAHGEYHQDLKRIGRQLLPEINTAADTPEKTKKEQFIKRYKLAKCTRSINHVVKNPFGKNHISDAIDCAKDVMQHPWGKRIGGLMLTLTGAAIIATSTLVALSSFGVLSPFSVAGITVGGSMLAGGIAVATGFAGLGVVGYGMYNLFYPPKNDMIKVGVNVLAEKSEKLPITHDEVGNPKPFVAAGRADDRYAPAIEVSSDEESDSEPTSPLMKKR